MKDRRDTAKYHKLNNAGTALYVAGALTAIAGIAMGFHLMIGIGVALSMLAILLKEAGRQSIRKYSHFNLFSKPEKLGVLSFSGPRNRR